MATLVRQCDELQKARKIHGRILSSGSRIGTFLGNLIVQMYGRCGSVDEANEAFSRIYEKNVFSWTMLMTAYAHNGHHKCAVHVYYNMHLQGVKLDCVIFSTVLGVCSAMRSSNLGSSIHAIILESDVLLENSLITMYGKCSCISRAAAVFHGMHCRSIASWNSIVAAFAEGKHFTEAMQLYQLMPAHDKVTLLHVAGLFADMGPPALEHGRSLHSRVTDSVDSDLMLANSVITMYGKCRSIADASCIFDKIRQRKDLVSWNSMMQAYVECGLTKEALCLYEELDFAEPDRITFTAVLDACDDIELGRHLHAQIMVSASGRDTAVQNSLLLMFAKCGSMEDAEFVFQNVDHSKRTTSSWNSMISAYEQLGQGTKAFAVFLIMCLEGYRPDKITFATLFQVVDISEGALLHKAASSCGLDKDLAVSTSMLLMYCHSSRIHEAREIFETMQQRDLVAWTAIIAALSQHQMNQEAIQHLCMMDLEGTQANQVTFSTVFSSCSGAGLLSIGRLLHEDAVAAGYENVVVATSLIDMYNKCGSIHEARAVFEKMEWRNWVSWNAMIGAAAKHGLCTDTLELYRLMTLEGASPDHITFTNVMFMCSHSGQSEEIVLDLCRSMLEDHGLGLSYSSLVDVLGRSGRLEDAEQLVEGMENEAGTAEYTTLLSSCKCSADLERACRIARKLLHLHPHSAAPYVLLAAIYNNTLDFVRSG